MRVVEVPASGPVSHPVRSFFYTAGPEPPRRNCYLTEVHSAGASYLLHGYNTRHISGNDWASGVWLVMVSEDGQVLWDSRAWDDVPPTRGAILDLWTARGGIEVAFPNPESTLQIASDGSLLNHYVWPIAVKYCVVADLTDTRSGPLQQLLHCNNIGRSGAYFVGDSWAEIAVLE